MADQDDAASASASAPAPAAVTGKMGAADSATSANISGDDGSVGPGDQHESSSSSAQALPMPGPHAPSASHDGHDGHGGDGCGAESEPSGAAAAARQDQDDANDMFLRWARGEQTPSPPDNDDGDGDDHAARDDGADHTNGGASANDDDDNDTESPALGGEISETSSSLHADSSAHRSVGASSPTTASPPPTTTTTTTTTQQMDAANDMFLRWARGEDQGEETANGPADDDDTSSSSSPGGPPTTSTAALKAAAETLEPSAVQVQEQEVQNDMFLRWARGEGQEEEQDQEENGRIDIDGIAGSNTISTAAAAAPASPNFDGEETPLQANRGSASDVPSEAKAGGQPVQHISANLFSQWASGAVDRGDDHADGIDNNTLSNSSGDDKEAGGGVGSSKAKEGIASSKGDDDDRASKPSPVRPSPIGLSDRAVTLPATRADLERAAGLGDPNHPLKKQRAQIQKDQHQSEQIPTAFPRPPMYSELVCLPRPLFFGSSLPPRVVAEAKKALDAGSAGNPAAQPSELKEDEADRIPIILKPEYRNLESAMQTFGRGDLIDVVSSSESSNSSRKHANKMQSISPQARRAGYVMTYQPVWGNAARKEREEKRKAAQEVFAADSFPCGEIVDEVIDLRDEQTLIAAGGQSSTKTIAKPISGKALGGSSKVAALRAKKAESVESIVKSTTNHPTQPSPPPSIVEEMSGESQSAAMPSAVEAVTPSKSSVASPADNLFLQWARGDGEAATAIDESNQSSSQKPMATDGSSSPVANPADNDFLKWARGEEGPKDAGTFIAPKSMEKQRTPPIAKESIPSSPFIDDALPSDQRQFLQWARGNASIDESTDLGTGTFVGAVSSSKNARKTASASKDFVPVLATDTFRPMARTDVGLQQSDSFEGSELKKQVGMNDNLSAALASLGGGDENGNGRTESMAAAEAGAAALLAADSLILTTKAGRLKTNLELTGGREPLYGCDDMPLPIEADLGVFETKEDQVKAAERRRSQEIIREAPIPNIFGPLTCPSPCSGPDDNQSWNSRSATRRAKSSGVPLTTGFDVPAIGGASVNLASPSSVSTAGHRRSRTTSSGVKAKSHRTTLSDASQSSVTSAPIKGTSTSSGSVTSTKKKNLPPPPPPITTDATFLRNQRGAYPGAGGSRMSSTEAPSISSTRSQSKRRSRDASGKNMRVGWWTGTSTKGDEKGSHGNSNGKDGVLKGDCVQVAPSPGDDPSSLQCTSPDSDSYPSHHVETGLSPSPMTLWKQNRSFSELHPATSTAKALPFLSVSFEAIRNCAVDCDITR